MAAILITVDLAKAHLLRPDLATDDPDLLQKMAVAELVIRNATSRTDESKAITDTWTDPATVPLEVQHAILMKLDELFDDRGAGAPDSRGADPKNPLELSPHRSEEHTSEPQSH